MLLLLKIYPYILIQLLETRDWLILFFKILSILILFVSVCLHKCVNAYVCGLNVHVETRGQPAMSFLGSPQLLFETGYLIDLKHN